MLQIKITITGTKEQIARMRRLNLSLMNFSEPMREIGTEIKKYFANQVFASQGGVLGVRWPTLAASTIMYKKKHYPQYATTPLVRSGAMKNSWASNATINSVSITNTAPQFPYHQSSAARSKIPYRPMLGINQDVETIVHKIISNDLDKKLGAI